MLHQDVATAQSSKNVADAVAVGVHQSRMRRGHERLVFQLGTVEISNAPQAGEVERCRKAINLALIDAEFAHQQVEHPIAGGRFDLEPHRRTESAAQQFALERLQQVVGVVFVDFEVFVAGDPEGVAFQHLHAGEDHRQVRGDDFFDRDEATIGEWQEPRQHLGHLDPGEPLFAVRRVAHHDGEVE